MAKYNSHRERINSIKKEEENKNRKIKYIGLTIMTTAILGLAYAFINSNAKTLYEKSPTFMKESYLELKLK